MVMIVPGVIASQDPCLEFVRAKVGQVVGATVGADVVGASVVGATAKWGSRIRLVAMGIGNRDWRNFGF